MQVDAQEHTGSWGVIEVPVTAGGHSINVFFRYRGQSRTRLGEGSREFAVGPGDGRLVITAVLGPLNGSNFRIAEPVSS
ncbi:hypothetical protein GCM10010424_53530 [Streptomyces lienomycini]